MTIRYRVELSEAERGELEAMLSGGWQAARKLKRAQILLAADGGTTDKAMAVSLAVGASTVLRTKRRFVEGNLERALSETPRPGAARKLSGPEEALLVATACASPPQGRARWTLELLAGEIVRLTQHESLSRETVRRRLSENALKPWREEMWCIPQVDGEFVARMEDGLDLYAEPPDPRQPVVCLDESPLQLIGETRQPIPPQPGQLARYDYEYSRKGTVNLFVVLDAHQPWRRVTITERRTAQDYARRLCELVDVDYPEAEGSGSCRITCQRTRLEHSTRPFRPRRRGGSCVAWSFTTRPSTPVGSTWWRSRSGCSRASAWTAASVSVRRLKRRSRPGSASATQPGLGSSGCSPPTKPAPR